MYSGAAITRTNLGASKTQFYAGDGTGRDTYVYNNNGGFCPSTQPTKIEELGINYLHIA